MPNSNRTGRCLAVLLLISLNLGCATMERTPPGRYYTNDSLRESGHGIWVELEFYNKNRIGGELLATSADSLWLRSQPHENEYFRYARGDINQIIRRLAGPTGVEAATATIGGIISTVSNGVFLLVTAPIWLIAGVGSSQQYVSQNVESVDKWEEPADWEQLTKWSRWPAGWPGAASGMQPKEHTYRLRPSQ